MVTKKAKQKQLGFYGFLNILTTICDSFGNESTESLIHDHLLKDIPTPYPTVWSDDSFQAVIRTILQYKIKYSEFVFPINRFSFAYSATSFPLRFYKPLLKMADNIHRAMQDIDLGADDDPIPLPPEVLNQAAAENRFIIIGQPVMLRRQNLWSIVAVMPRVWGQSGIVHG